MFLASLTFSAIMGEIQSVRHDINKLIAVWYDMFCAYQISMVFLLPAYILVRLKVQNCKI